VIALSNSKSELKHIPYEQAYGRAFDDLPRRVPDLTKIKNIIGFAPGIIWIRSSSQSLAP